MPENTTHATDAHRHGAGCGHPSVKHDGHTDYVHDGHLHRVSGDHVEEHALAVGGEHLALCTPSHACGAHDMTHRHGPDCGHPRVLHGDHDDYLVDGHLHHAHGDHCDHHGALPTA